MLPATRGRAASIGSQVVLAAIALGVVLLAIAMARYPGGSSINPAAEGHSFWFNFLCDLTNDVAVNGRANQAGAHFARAGLGALCVALGCFWLILPGALRMPPGRGLSSGVRTLGVLSVLGLVSVPVASGASHLVAVFVSFIPAFVATVLALIGAVRYSGSRVLCVVIGAALLVAVFDSLLYARSYMVHPRVVPPALPLFQRAALLLTLTWMTLVAVRELGYSTTKR